MKEVVRPKLRLLNDIHGTTMFFTMIYATDTVDITIDAYSYTMAKDDVILCREGSSYTLKDDGKAIILGYDHTFFDSLFTSQLTISRIIYEFITLKNPNHEHLYFSCSSIPQAIQLFEMIIDEFDQSDRFHEKLINIYTDGFLTLLERTRPETLIVPNSTMISTNRFGMLLQYIGVNYSDCTLKDVAEKYGYNPDYLSVRFKKVTGKSFSEFLNEIRINQAAQMLLRDELTVEEIANAVGYSDKGWFIKRFKKQFKMTPANYRRQMVKNANESKQ